MADQCAYVNALEQKIQELTGIAIRKNVESEMATEAAEICASAADIAKIRVLKRADAFMAPRNPAIKQTFALLAVESARDQNDQFHKDGASELPTLPYAEDALEPNMSADIVNVHYKKHHAGYVKNLNAAHATMVEAENENNDDKYNKLSVAILFNGGSHLNHTIYWRNMCPGGKAMSEGLSKAISDRWGSVDAFKAQFKTKTAGVKGSGWGWLAYDKKNCKLDIYTTANQDTVEIVHGAVPLLTCDVWEHAYYLQYKNLRASFIDSWFNLVNWADVEARYNNATEKTEA